MESKHSHTRTQPLIKQHSETIILVKAKYFSFISYFHFLFLFLFFNHKAFEMAVTRTLAQLTHTYIHTHSHAFTKDKHSTSAAAHLAANTHDTHQHKSVVFLLVQQVACGIQYIQ